MKILPSNFFFRKNVKNPTILGVISFCQKVGILGKNEPESKHKVKI